MKLAKKVLAVGATLPSLLLLVSMTWTAENRHHKGLQLPLEANWKPIAECAIAESMVNREPHNGPDGAHVIGFYADKDHLVGGTMMVTALDGPQVGVFLGWSQTEGLSKDAWRVTFTFEDGSSMVREAGGSGPHALLFKSGWRGGGTDVASIRKVTLYYNSESK